MEGRAAANKRILNFKLTRKNPLKIFLLYSLLFYATQYAGQEKFTIGGTIKSQKTGETIIGATVTVISQQVAVTSNEYGFLYSEKIQDLSSNKELNQRLKEIVTTTNTVILFPTANSFSLK
jgi:hypothetical protein